MIHDETSRTISTSVRPARVAILLNVNDPDWMQTCLRAIEWSTSVWGGWYTCFVPTDGETIDERFWELLECFDPDYVYAYQKTGEDLKIAQPERFREYVQRHVKSFTDQFPDSDQDYNRHSIEEQVTSASAETFNISDTLTKAMFRRLNPFRYRDDPSILSITARPERTGFPLTDVAVISDNLAVPLILRAIEVEASPFVELMAFAMTGKVWPELLNRLDQKNIKVQTMAYTDDTIGDLLRMLWKEVESTFALSMANCSIYYPVGTSRSQIPCLVIVGDKMEDFCLYYDFQRMRGNTIWLPKELFEAYQSSHQSSETTLMPSHPREHQVYRQILRFLRGETKTSNVQYLSYSLDEASLRGIAQSMVDYAGSNEASEEVNFNINSPITSLLPHVRRLYERDNVGHRYRDQFSDGLSVNFIDTPKPKHFKTVPPYDLFWITEAWIEGFKLPLSPSLGPMTIVQRNYDTEETRVTTDGFAYFCPYIAHFGGDVDSILVRPRIQITQPLAVVECMFEATNLHMQYSDKGNYHLECLRKFGSLENFAAFWRDENNRRLIDAYFYQGKSEHGKGDKIGDRRYLDFQVFERVVAAGDNHIQEAAAALIEGLVLKGVLHRGFVFKCEACRQLGWYAIEDVTEQFRCTRCRTRQTYTSKHWIMPHEPSWYYQLDEIVYETYHNGGHIPTLTLDLLRRQTKESFFYLPECELIQHGLKKHDMELDFCCCVDGHVYIGEAKKANELESTDKKEHATLTKYRNLADQIGARYVVLSTLSEAWNERTLRNANTIIGEKCLRTFTQSDLLKLDLPAPSVRRTQRPDQSSTANPYKM